MHFYLHLRKRKTHINLHNFMSDMTQWTRRHTILDEHDHPRDDWIIKCDGQDVGRTYRRPDGRDGQWWYWVAWPHPQQTGLSNTLEDALESIRAAVSRRQASR